MAKEKHLRYETETKDLTFYYEIVGIISIILPILAFARLGLIGFYIMLIFKIVFGDWYFLFLLAFFCYGLRCLIYHKPMNFKALRVIGIFLILLGVMMLSHFPMHKYIVSFDIDGSGGYYRRTIGLYLDYFKNYYDGMVVGGGILGSTFFYLFYSLFSSLGTIFMILVFEFVGIVFFTEKTIKDFLLIFGKVGMKIYEFIKKKAKSLKYDIVIPKKIKKSKNITINDLPESIGIKFEGMEQNNAKLVKDKICGVLNQMNVFYNDVRIVVGYNVTTFTIDSIQYIELSKLNLLLKDKLDQNFMIKKEVKTKKTIIELNNEYDSMYDIRTGLISIKEFKNNFLYPICITSLNNNINIDLKEEVGLVIEDNNNYSNSFKNAFILMTYIKNPRKLFKIKYLDSSNFSSLVYKANELLNLLNNEQVQNIDEYNLKQDKKNFLKRNIIIIDDLINIIKNKEDLEKFTFILQVAVKVGFYIIIRTTDKKTFPPILQNYIHKILYFKDSVNLEISKNLRIYEAFFENQDIIERVSYVMIEDSEFEKFKNLL